MNQSKQTAELKEIKGNKKILLKFKNFDTIYQAKKESHMTASEIYEYIFNEYNDTVRKQNAIIVKQVADAKAKEAIKKAETIIKVKEEQKKVKKEIKKQEKKQNEIKIDVFQITGTDKLNLSNESVKFKTHPVAELIEYFFRPSIIIGKLIHTQIILANPHKRFYKSYMSSIKFRESNKKILNRSYTSKTELRESSIKELNEWNSSGYSNETVIKYWYALKQESIRIKKKIYDINYHGTVTYRYRIKKNKNGNHTTIYLENNIELIF